MQAARCVQAASRQRPQKNRQLRAAISAGRIRVHRSRTGQLCLGRIPAVGATALQARVPSRPTSSACNRHKFKGGWTPEPIKVATPPASCTCPGRTQPTTTGSTLLLEQLVLMLCGGTSPRCLAARLPRRLATRRAGLAARLSPVSPVSWRGRWCCCQLVSHGTGESGCRIPGAQEGRSQDTQRLQQRLSEANIKGGAGAAGLGSWPS